MARGKTLMRRGAGFGACAFRIDHNGAAIGQRGFGVLHHFFDAASACCAINRNHFHAP
jgi:hypothetical protein